MPQRILIRLSRLQTWTVVYRHDIAMVMVSLYHLALAVLILQDKSAVGVSSLHLLEQVLGNSTLLACMLICISCAVLVSPFLPFSWAWVLIFPQQLVLFISCYSAVLVVINSAYADGVVRPRAFIAADQLIYLCVFVWYTVSVLRKFGIALFVADFIDARWRQFWVAMQRLL